MTKKNRNQPVDFEKVLALAPHISKLLDGVQQVELEHVILEVGDLELFIPSGIFPKSALSVSEKNEMAKPEALIPEKYAPPVISFPGKIREVRIGATRSEGGSRSRAITIGGASVPAYDAIPTNPAPIPVIALDVFDMEIPLPRVLKENVREVIHDPAEWARLNVEKFGADMVTVHLTSTDPFFSNTSPSTAAKTVDDVLQAVDVPIIVGGCGDPKKDAAVFTHIAESARGERLVLNSVTLDMAEQKILEKVAVAARDHGHVVLAFTGLELNSAKELNRRLYQFLPPDQIVMDLTTVALGYGLEYSFSIHERARHAALMGDAELAHPVISGATNAWAAREAWMQMAPEYGPRELRGPLWETLNALTLLLAGIDLFLMMHPAAVLTTRSIIKRLGTAEHEPADKAADWVGVRI